VGKTHFAREVSKLVGTGMGFISMSSLTAGWVLSGASSQWKGARPGKVFETLVDGQYANPVMVVDEIDKARGEHAYDPLGALYSLLELDTAQTFTDEFAEVAIDASQVIWVATANDERAIPEPILNRVNVYEVQMPDRDAARTIARRLYTGIRAAHDWGRRFDEQPTDAVLDRLAELAPREMRRAWMTAFGNARLDARDQVEVRDLPDAHGKRSAIGFVQ
jgi:ATP-dependent Lon protease